MILLQEGGPLPGWKLGSCLTLRNELSEETHLLTKQETLLGKATGAESSREGNPGELLCRVARNLGFYGDGIGFWVVFSRFLTQSPSWWCTPGSAKLDASKQDSGRWLDMWCLLSTFPEIFHLVVVY